MIDARKTAGAGKTAKVRIVKARPTTPSEKRRISDDASLYAVTV
jgi:hypothetical protein